MLGRSMLTRVALLAGLVAAAAASSAAGNTSLGLSVSSGELGRVSLTTRALTFTDEEGTFSIVCEVTRVVGLHRSTAKVRGTLAGLVREVRIANCRGGTVTVLTETLPWHVTYESFAGTLPSISSVSLQLNGIGFLVSAFFGLGRCLYGGAAQGSTSGGTTVTGLDVSEMRSLPLVTNLGGFECPPGGVFRGRFSVSPSVRLSLGTGGGEEECRRPPSAVERISVTASEFSEAPTVTAQCDRTRINSISTSRPGVIAIADRERAIGREFRRGQSFRYDLIMRDQPGALEYRDEVVIATNYGNAVTRITFRNT